MDHTFDVVGDRRSIRGKKPCIEPPHAARRGDRAGNQEQAGRVGQQAGIGERFPPAFQRRGRTVALAAETEPGLFAGLAARRDPDSACARRRDLRAPSEHISFD
jgi:hypothetical protein